jgi:citrate synthase
MLEAIQRDGGDVKKYVAMAKDKTSGFRLMGFGHRVYKNFDPRAKIIKEWADKVLAKLGLDDQLLDIAKELEAAALRGRLLRRAEALPERRLLLGHHLPRARLPDQHVHRPLRARPPARLDRPLEGADGGLLDEDRPAAPDLHRADHAPLGAGQPAQARLAQQARAC